MLEGTVGGHWGLFDDATRAAEVRLGRAGVQPSALALAGGGRRCARGVGVCGGAAGAPARGARAWTSLAWGAIALNAAVGRRAGRLDGRERAAGKPRRRRLDCARSRSRCLPSRRRSRARRRWQRMPRPPAFAADHRSEPERSRRRLARAGARAAADRAGRAGGAVGARAGVRSALPRLSVRAADRGRRAVRAARAHGAASGRARGRWRKLSPRRCWRCARSSSPGTRRWPTGRRCGSARRSALVAVSLVRARAAPG